MTRLLAPALAPALALAGGVALAAGGCAVGYGAGFQSASVSAKAASEPMARISASYQELRIIDSTGIVLAALVNMGRQYNARNDAIEAARYKTPNQDGTVTVEYSYKPMPILSGLLTDLRLRVPLGTPTIEQPPGSMARGELEYWAFDIRPEFYTFRPIKSLPLVSSLWLNVDAATWKDPSLSGVDLFQLDMGFGASTSYVVSEHLVATGRIKLGILSPLLASLVDGSVLNPTAELEVGYRPWASDKLGVMLSGVAYIGREFELEGRSMVVSRIGINAAITLGSQVPNKARRQPAEPAGKPASAGTLSGVVCVGDDTPPECKRVVEAAPDAVKILFVACGQATVTAINANPPDFSTQPDVCRTAGTGIAKYAKDRAAELDAPTKRLVEVAAATAFDFAAVGFEVRGGRLGADHCAMIEHTFNHVVTAVPSRVKVVDAAVTQCRARYRCAPDADGLLACTPKAP